MKFRFGPLAHGWISTAFSLSKLAWLMRAAHAHLPAAARVHLDGVTAGVFSHLLPEVSEYITPRAFPNCTSFLNSFKSHNMYQHVLY